MTKVHNIFKNLGKAPSQIHSTNLFENSLNETKKKGRYEESQKELAPLSYQEANHLNFQFAKWYTHLYHVVSALLGLVTVVLLAFIFSGGGGLGKYPAWLVYVLFGLVFLVLSALLVGIEVFKSSLAKGIFKNMVLGGKVGVPAVIGLGLVMVFSILVSAVGGAVLSYEMNDKSEEISKIYNVQSDSIRKLHDENLEAVNASIQAYKANLNKGSYWGKYATREKLDKAIETRNQLLAAANIQINSVATAKEKEVSLNSTEGKNYAVISAIIVLVLELLSILAYWFQYVYHSNCEKEAVNFAVLSPTLTVQEPSKTDIQLLAETLQNLINGGSSQLHQLTNTTSIHTGDGSPNKVGFAFSPFNSERQTVKNEQHSPLNTESLTVNTGELKDNEKLCLHCGTKFVYKHWNAKYCGEKCRITAWEAKTGKKFKKMKKDNGEE